MDNNTMTKIIYDFVKKTGGVSFVEIESLFRENGFEYKGSLMVGTSARNTVAWLDWNQAAIDVLNEALRQGIRLTVTSPLIYYFDGCAPDLPIAKSTRGYKKELHWLPVVLN